MPISAAVLTVSDKASKGERVDTAGPAVEALLVTIGIDVIERLVLPDERELIAQALMVWADAAKIDLVLTTGGTGLAARDVTPEATLDVAERNVPGIAEVMREVGRRSTHLAALSRGVVVIRKRTLIVNLPGSQKGAVESLAAVIDLIPHAVDTLRGPTEAHPVDEV
jgi:molybdenum cofactor synthesis domain-containing protein